MERRRGNGRSPRPARARRTIRLAGGGTAVAVFFAAALAGGYLVSHHQRRRLAVHGVSARITPGRVPRLGGPAVTEDAVAAPAPTPTPATPGAALASGTLDLGNPLMVPGGGGYYLYASQSVPFVHVPVSYGTGGGTWQTVTDALPDLPPWVGTGVVTAPEVHQFGTQWVLYFSAPASGAPLGTRCIGTATAGSPGGPFAAAPTPLVCQRTLGGSFDPRVFVDPAGNPSLLWLSATAPPPDPGTPEVWSQPLRADGLALAGRPAALYRPDLPWQAGSLSSPDLVAGPGHDWLLYSAGGGFTSPTDAIGDAACAGPSGPCTDVSTTPLLASNAQGSGPGDPAVTTVNGGTWLVYNPSYSPGGTLDRWVDAVRLGVGPTGPYLAATGMAPAPPQPATPATAGPTAPPAAAPAPPPPSRPPAEVDAAPAATPPPATVVAPTAGGAGATAVEAAVSQLGVAYVYGAESPGHGFDCSGLVQWAWGQAGVSIPRTAAAQYAELPHVPLSALEPGDLLFYYNLDGDNTIDHVVMYVGSGPDGGQTVIQAPASGQTVSYSPVFTGGLVGAARP
ncbi:MAG: family 43 glycosylhydrolase [Acidimicrobiales bacterium]